MGPIEMAALAAAKERRQRLYPPQTKRGKPALRVEPEPPVQIVQGAPEVSSAIIPIAVAPMHEIIRIVADVFGVSLNEIVSPHRQRNVTRARQAAAYLATIHTQLSFPAIGRGIKRDHTTVLHSFRVVPRYMVDDPLYAAKIAQADEIIRTRLGGANRRGDQ